MAKTAKVISVTIALPALRLSFILKTSLLIACIFRLIRLNASFNFSLKAVHSEAPNESLA
jgi:hypothetical protein